MHLRFYTLCAVGEPDAPGCVWRSATSWPPENSRAVVMPLGGGTSLFSANKRSNGAGFRNFTFDPSNPCPTIGGANLDTKFGIGAIQLACMSTLDIVEYYCNTCFVQGLAHTTSAPSPSAPT